MAEAVYKKTAIGTSSKKKKMALFYELIITSPRSTFY